MPLAGKIAILRAVIRRGRFEVLLGHVMTMGGHMTRCVQAVQGTLLAFLLYPALCAATTWVDVEVPDPIDPKARCKVHEPMSYGGYIYHWPEKYDQVFWPRTDRHGIWFCEKTGFTAFIGGFEGLTPEEKTRIARYLRENHAGSGDVEQKLRLLEGIYALRETDDAFKTALLRVLARWYQNLGQWDKANEYRRTALSRIESGLAQPLPDAQRLEYLYIAANYSRVLGDLEASDRWLAELRGAIGSVKDESVADYASYLSALADETPRIQPGGALDPGGEDGGGSVGDGNDGERDAPAG